MKFSVDTAIAIMLFLSGTLIGAGLLGFHHWDIERTVRAVEAQKDKQIARLKADYAKLQEETAIWQQTTDCADAFRRGKENARTMGEYEKFAKTFEDRRVRLVNTTPPKTDGEKVAVS